MLCLACIDLPGSSFERGYGRCLCAEGKVADDAKLHEEGDAAACKVLCTAAGKDEGELEYEVCTSVDGVPCPCPLVENGGRSALRYAAAHDDDDAIHGGESSAQFTELPGVSVMKWIVFGDYPDDVHIPPPFFLFNFIKKECICVVLRSQIQYLVFS